MTKIQFISWGTLLYCRWNLFFWHWKWRQNFIFRMAYITAALSFEKTMILLHFHILFIPRRWRRSWKRKHLNVQSKVDRFENATIWKRNDLKTCPFNLGLRSNFSLSNICFYDIDFHKRYSQSNLDSFKLLYRHCPYQISSHLNERAGNLFAKNLKSFLLCYTGKWAGFPPTSLLHTGKT